MAWDEELEKHVTALTPDDVAAAFRRNLDPSRLSIVKAGDFKKAAGTK
jgi:zinc protease